MVSKTPYASNSYGVETQPLDAAAAGAPTTMYYHGGSIVVNNNIIGRVNTWNTSGAYNREGTHIYEVHNNTWGLPIDYVPGRATGFKVAYVRTEVWSQELEIALGYGAVWNNLTDQTRPFVAEEYLFRGTDIYRTWRYQGCWLEEKNLSAWESEGNGVVSVSGNMAYVSRKRTT